MKLTNPGSHRKTFYMILLGIMIGLSVGIWVDGSISLLVLLVAAPMLLLYMFTNVILSIDIIDDHLVLRTMNLLRRKTTLFNIKEVELQLFYTRPAQKASGYYSMHLIKNGKVLHNIEHDVAELSAFIASFNSKKAVV